MAASHRLQIPLSLYSTGNIVCTCMFQISAVVLRSRLRLHHPQASQLPRGLSRHRPGDHDEVQEVRALRVEQRKVRWSMSIWIEDEIINENIKNINILSFLNLRRYHNGRMVITRLAQLFLNFYCFNQTWLIFLSFWTPQDSFSYKYMIDFTPVHPSIWSSSRGLDELHPSLSKANPGGNGLNFPESLIYSPLIISARW